MQWYGRYQKPIIYIRMKQSYRQSMLPVTTLLVPLIGLTVVTMWSWSCLVKRFTSRRSSSANSQSSKAPAQDPSLTFKSRKTSPGFIISKNLLLTWVWCNNYTLFWHPFDIYNSSLSLHASFAQFLAGSLRRVTVYPNRSLPAPATEAGSTEQQSAVCEDRQGENRTWIKFWFFLIYCKQFK